MLRKFLPLGFVIVFNLWIWRIFSLNLVAGVLVVLASVAVWLSINSSRKLYFYISIVTFVCILLLQWKTSSKNSLTFLNDNEKLLQEERLRGYPPLSIDVAGKTVWIPAANWLELRPEALVFYKLKANLSEVLDFNLFFFANHPRERVGVVEYEKFPYILLPVFILGLLSIKRTTAKYFLLAASPFLLNTIIGNSNPAGPFGLFPFITISIASGLTQMSGILSKKKFLIPALIVFCLVFIQIIAYAKY